MCRKSYPYKPVGGQTELSALSINDVKAGAVFLSTKKSEIFGTETNIYGAVDIYRNLQVVEFPKCQPFNQKFSKFGDENQI